MCSWTSSKRSTGPNQPEMYHFIALCFLLLIVCFQTTQAEEYDKSLLNSKTGEKFTEMLIDSFTTDLINIANDKREERVQYAANDVATVQAIRSMEKSLIDLSAFFAQNKSSLIVQKYLNGLAIEYFTTPCDSVVSNRFPRNPTSIPSPWSSHKDYVYYHVDCSSNATDILSTKYQSLHPEIRVKRSLQTNQLNDLNTPRNLKIKTNKRSRRSANDPSICGSKSIYEGLTGNITSPGYPGNYSAGINCVWHIKVPVKYAVSITFDSFNLEHDKFCFFDSVEFFDGASVNSKSIRRVCGTTIPQNIRSSLGIITIRMKTDDTIESSGFVLRWNLTEPNYPHPGFFITSNIVVDQLGPNANDLNKFALIFQNPTTCPRESKDVYCYFQYKAVIISRIVSTITFPPIKMHGKTAHVKLDHIIDLKYFPSLYRSKKYCMRWNDTIKFTENGAWSRYGGKVYSTDSFSTTCHFEEPGIFAVFAEEDAYEETTIFRFTGSFYAGIFFSIVWLIVLIAQWVYSRRINVPEWMNFNQAVSLLLFLGVTLCGLHLEYVKSTCSLLAFFLYYFGLGVFFWQFLKAAQVSGKFDDFFAKGRNIYLFYFLLGWTLPVFIAGMAAGALFTPTEEAKSCWLALVGGTIWGYTSPTYFLVLANIWILYKVSKKTKKNLKTFHHAQLRKRVIRDILQLLLYIMTWTFGLLCILNKTIFSLQYMFSMCITLSVLFMSLGAKQRRPGYQKIHYIDFEATRLKSTKEEAIEKMEKETNAGDHNVFVSQTMSMKIYKKWQRFRKHDLKLGNVLLGTNFNKSFDYNAYYALDEEGSRSSLRPTSSLRSESALNMDNENAESEIDQATDAESELDIVSSDEEDLRSSKSPGSRVETKADVLVSGKASYIDGEDDEISGEDNDNDDEDNGNDDEDNGNDDEDNGNDDEDNGNDEDDELKYDDEERMSDAEEEGRYSKNQSEGRATSGKQSVNAEEVADDDGKGSKNEVDQMDAIENDETGEGDNNEGGNNEEEEVENKADVEEENESENDEEEMTGKHDDVNVDEKSEKESDIEEDNEPPKFTINAFGGSPRNDGEENRVVMQRSPLPSRPANKEDVDRMSVCSLMDEDETAGEQDDVNESQA